MKKKKERVVAELLIKWLSLGAEEALGGGIQLFGFEFVAFWFRICYQTLWTRSSEEGGNVTCHVMAVLPWISAVHVVRSSRPRGVQYS